MLDIAELSRRPLARQAARFIIVGIANTVVTLGTVFVVHDVAGASVEVASATGFIVGAIQGFVLNRFWTFAGIDHAVPIAVQMVGFVVVNLVAGSIFTAVNVGLSRFIPLLVSSLIAAATIMPVSFTLNRWGVFRERRQ